MKTLDVNTERRRKWWQIATTQDEVDLFTCIARHPKYSWRSLKSITRFLGWDKDKIDSTLKPFIQNRMIIAKQTKEGMSLAYWERVGNELESKNDAEMSDEEKLEVLNKQIKMTKKKTLIKQRPKP